MILKSSLPKFDISDAHLTVIDYDDSPLTVNQRTHIRKSNDQGRCNGMALRERNVPSDLIMYDLS